jgi:hypothetical protein
VLYRHAIERDNERLQAIYGTDENKKSNRTGSLNHSGTAAGTSQDQSASAPPRFEGPNAYAHLSAQERDALTQKMMGSWKKWANEEKPTGGKQCRKPT